MTTVMIFVKSTFGGAIRVKVRPTVRSVCYGQADFSFVTTPTEVRKDNVVLDK